MSRTSARSRTKSVLSTSEKQAPSEKGCNSRVESALVQRRELLESRAQRALACLEVAGPLLDPGAAPIAIPAALTGAPASGVPQSLQNRASSAFSRPQLGQAAMSGVYERASCSSASSISDARLA